MPPRTKSSKRWLDEHFSDPYVEKAHAMGYRARSAFKLIEIQEKDKFIKPGMFVVDLGAAPGGWSQVASNFIGRKGKLIALDILPMEELPNVEFICGDFREDEVLAQLTQALEGNSVDVVISDIAPNTSGVPSVDQARSMYLAELTLEFAIEHLKVGGSFLVKVFQGVDFEAYHKRMKSEFTKVISRKPDASRDRSREIYLLGLEKKA